MLCDRNSSICLAKNLVTIYSKTKDIDVQYHFIRDMVKDEIRRYFRRLEFCKILEVHC